MTLCDHLIVFISQTVVSLFMQVTVGQYDLLSIQINCLIGRGHSPFVIDRPCAKLVSAWGHLVIPDVNDDWILGQWILGWIDMLLVSLNM